MTKLLACIAALAIAISACSGGEAELEARIAELEGQLADATSTTAAQPSTTVIGSTSVSDATATSEPELASDALSDAETVWCDNFDNSDAILLALVSLGLPDARKAEQDRNAYYRELIALWDSEDPTFDLLLQGNSRSFLDGWMRDYPEDFVTACSAAFESR